MLEIMRDGGASRALRDGQVDPSLLVPRIYSATINPGDTVIFTDSKHLHKFKSLDPKRVSVAGIFTARRVAGSA